MNLRRVVEQAKFIYSPSQKAFEKQAKIIEEQGRKKLKQLKSMEKNWLSQMCLLEHNSKVYHLIRKKKYSISLLRKEMETLKNYSIVLIFKVWYVILRDSLKI